MIQFTFFGKVQQQERTRAKFNPKTRKSFVYEPVNSRTYKKRLKEYLNTLDIKKMEGCLKLSLDVYCVIPKSYTKKRIKEITAQKMYKPTKPDLSNYLKLVEDVMNGICYQDDNQLVEISCRKFFCNTKEEECIKVKIESV